MADAAREQTLAAVAANLLSRINGASPYAYVLKGCHRDESSLGQNVALMPCVVMHTGTEEIDARTTAADHVMLPLTLVAYLENDTAAAVETQLRNIESDLYRAMVSDDSQYHSGTVLWVDYGGVSEELGTEDLGIIGIAAEFKLHCAFSRSEPTSYAP